ncbi:hypothetical protein OIU74_004570 [Salix koriyanagi]|uniref:Uncharacterized protein n=1 Tax=Salix koriyanagi TaxID=2511006 RepID=A0A9Q0UMA8_9ROSI|nr:hypothetical protein OIU74_004570 [Salix koriyanagi]
MDVYVVEKFLEWWKGDAAVDGYCCSQSGVGVEEVPDWKITKLLVPGEKPLLLAHGVAVHGGAIELPRTVSGFVSGWEMLRRKAAAVLRGLQLWIKACFILQVMKEKPELLIWCSWR